MNTRKMSISKPIVSITELVQMLQMSRARFYQLVHSGFFPKPLHDERSKRPYYDSELQQKCLESRSSGIGVIPKKVLEMLRQLKKEADLNCPFILLNQDRWAVVCATWHKMRQEGKAREWQNWRLICNPLRDFKVYCKNAGIKTTERLNLHCLRKSWACNLAENGISPKTLCELGGWSDPSVLNEYYSKATDANRDKARQVLDDLMGGSGV